MISSYRNVSLHVQWHCATMANSKECPQVSPLTILQLGLLLTSRRCAISTRLTRFLLLCKIGRRRRHDNRKKSKLSCVNDRSSFAFLRFRLCDMDMFLSREIRMPQPEMIDRQTDSKELFSVLISLLCALYLDKIIKKEGLSSIVYFDPF